MRVWKVVTNETCNQNCWFCHARRPQEDPAFIARTAVVRRLAEARAAGAREIVLTGGEPTLRRDLPDLVRRASANRARVVLETNAARIGESLARDLAAAGLGLARVQLVAWGEAADGITREPGGFAAALAGIHALGAAGVRVEITTPVVRRNLDLVASLPANIVETGLPASALVLLVPLQAPDPSELAPLPAVGPAIVAVADEARRVGLAVRLDPSTYLPPCVLGRPERIAHLFALNRGNASRPGYAPVAACGECLVNDRCPGLPESLATTEVVVQPIREARTRRRLTVASSVEEQVARELVTRDIVRGAYGQVPEYTVRVNFHCNQACEFCFVSTHLPPAGDAAVREQIERAGAEKGILVLSGGEPTLNPRLVEYVRLGRQLGVLTVELQTNATRLGDRALTEALVEAGVEQIMVSLHGATAEVSDAVTGAPGTFVQTLAGLDEVARTSVRLRLNFVFCQANYREFPATVDLVASRWPRAGIVFSFVGSHTDVVPRTNELIPRYSEVLPFLMEGLARAEQRGVEVTGFDSMCGLPLCLVPEAERASFSPVDLPSDAGGGEFLKTEACEQCAESRRCYGIRRGYAQLYGTSELVPIPAAPRPSSEAAPANSSPAVS